MLRLTTLSLALLLLAATPAVQAQSGSIAPEFGVKGGLTFSDVNVDDLDASNQVGWGAGFYLDLATPLLHLQPEALFTKVGFKDGNFTGNTTEHPLDYRLYSLEIPVLAVFSLPIPAVEPRVFAGPAYSIPLKSEFKIYDEWYDIKDDTKASWNLVLGAGVQLADRVGVELRYELGLSEVSDRPLDEIINDIGNDVEDEFSTDKDLDAFKTRTFAVMVSVALN